MGQPECSIVVPTFARAALTVRALQSALAQDVDLEVLVVDDGSPAPFVFEDDARVSVLRLPTNEGAAAARNAGVAAAKADWVALLDSDDVWTVGSLRPRLEQARAAPDAERTIWGAGFADIWPDGRRGMRMPVASASPVDFASGCWSCPGSTALFSRTAWRLSGGQDPSLRRLEDYDWLLRWGLSGGQLAIAPIIAAEVMRGGRAPPEAVAAATGLLRSKHATIPEALHQRMESYLALELGASLLHASKPVSGLRALARSFMLRPRFHAALEPFWTVG